MAFVKAVCDEWYLKREYHAKSGMPYSHVPFAFWGWALFGWQTAPGILAVGNTRKREPDVHCGVSKAALTGRTGAVRQQIRVSQIQ